MGEFYTSDLCLNANFTIKDKKNIAIVAMYHLSLNHNFCCAESLVQQETKNANGLNVVVKFIDKQRD